MSIWYIQLRGLRLLNYMDGIFSTSGTVWSSVG
uniref:Uncharacterized protein n=1 Tax=Arundo donax TaxID=35708 RepID=A0A0A9C4T5_ARUDO